MHFIFLSVTGPRLTDRYQSTARGDHCWTLQGREERGPPKRPAQNVRTMTKTVILPKKKHVSLLLDGFCEPLHPGMY